LKILTKDIIKPVVVLTFLTVFIYKGLIFRNVKEILLKLGFC